MRKKHYIFLIISCCYGFVWAQGGMYPFAGARLSGIGNNGENFRDINALFFNQAGIAFVKNTSILLAAENRFFSESLTQGAAGVVLPVKNAAFGFSTQTFGNNYYKEGTFGIAYSRLLSEEMAIGAKVNYHFVQVEEGGSQGVFIAELGVQQQILSWLHLGAHIFNPIRSSFSNGYRLPAIFRLGSLMDLSPKVQFHTGIEKAIEDPVNVKFGVSYQAARQFAFRFGLQTFPRSISIGTGFEINPSLTFDFAANWNQILGISPAFTTIYEFKKEKNERRESRRKQ